MSIKNLNKIVLLIFLLISNVFSKNVLFLVDSMSDEKSALVQSELDKLNNDYKITMGIIYNDMSRTKVYIKDMKKSDHNYNQLKEQFLFRISNLDLDFDKKYVQQLSNVQKIIKVEKETVSFENTDILFAIDDSGSMDSFKKDVDRDIKIVSKAIDFKTSKFGMLVCPNKNLRSKGFTNDKSKIDKYLNYKELDFKTESGRELPCALKTAVYMFKNNSKNKNKVMFYFGDGKSGEDLDSLRILKNNLGVSIVPIAVGSMNKETLGRLASSGKILESKNVDMKSLSSVTTKVYENKLVIEKQKIRIPTANINLFNNMVKFKVSHYDSVYLFSDLEHNANNINYTKLVKEYGKKNANKKVLNKYKLDMDRILVLPKQ